MRLTTILCQVNYHRHPGRIWKRQGKMPVQELVIPPELKEMNVKIIDAKNFLQKHLREPIKEKTVLPVPPSAFLKKKYIYCMSNETRITESENQTLSLTKTVAYQGLPKLITSLIDCDSLPNQDDLVQNSILQAQVWDAVQYRLPMRVDPNLPGIKFRKEFGILYKKKVSSLLEKLSYLCDSATGNYTGCFQRYKASGCFSELSIERSGESVIFQLPCDIVMTSTSPLKNFASRDEIMKTKELDLPNIYPIKPMLDLTKLDSFPLKSEEVFLHNDDHLHTLFIGQKSFENWSSKEMLANAIATCFTFTASAAQRKYGLDVKNLPESISVQCMFMDIKTVNFLTYQLNTLDLDDDDGIKNQVWVDEPADLYESISERKLMSNYNPSVFPKMLALHLNGLHSSSL